MQEIEKTGKTVEEAVEAALEELGATREEVEIEVVAESGRGLLGIFGQTEALVRVKRTSSSSMGATAVELTQKMLAAMEIDATVSISEEDAEGAIIDIDAGDDTGLVIGRRGDTLGALQHLVALLVNKGEEHRKRILLNAGGYLEKREQALQVLAERTAQKVRATGRAVTLEALSPRERRIVHLALAEDSSVETSSVGVEPNRCVVVSPTKSAAPPPRSSRPSRQPREPRQSRESRQPKAPNQPPWKPE